MNHSLTILSHYPPSLTGQEVFCPGALALFRKAIIFAKQRKKHKKDQNFIIQIPIAQTFGSDEGC